MKQVLYIVCICLVKVLSAQNKKYFERLDASSPVDVIVSNAGGSALEVRNFDESNYAGMVYSYININRKHKGRKAFEQEADLDQFCDFAVHNYPKSFFTKRKYDSKVVRYTDLSLKRIGVETRVFEASCFCIDLMNLKGAQNFYYKRLDASTDLHLFLGKRSRISDPEHPDYVDPVAMLPLNEQAFCEQIVRQLKWSLGNRALYEKSFEKMSIALRLDKSSLDKRKIPRAFVFIILTGKQLQRVKQKKIKSNVDRNNPYTILK